MVIVSWLSNSFPLSIVAMTISAISMMSIAMMVVARLSISLSLSIITVSITSIMAVSMMIVSWLSSGSCFGFPLCIVSMTISTISISTMTISMVISWFSSSCAKDGKSNSNQKIHVVFGLNFSETPLLSFHSI